MYQPTLNLKFDPPLLYTGTDTFYDKVINALKTVYPDLKWYGGDPVKDFNPFINNETYEIHYLTIGYFIEEPYKLTYTSDEHVDYNSINGYKWVEENSIDYDETSKWFDSLNESEVKSHFLQNKVLVFNPPIERDDYYNKLVPILKKFNILWYDGMGVDLNDPNAKDVFRSYSSFEYFLFDTVDRLLRRGNWIMSAVEDQHIIDSYRDDDNNETWELFERSEKVDGWGFINHHKDVMDFDTHSAFDSLNESEEVDRYIRADLDFFYKNKTPFYEISPKTGKPFQADDYHKNLGMDYDSVGIIMYIGKTDGYYDICWSTKNGQDCLKAGPEELIKELNINRLIPVDIYNSKLDTESLFNSLNEGYWDEYYKSKRYVQKFDIGDRVIMNGSVGGKSLNNELGTVLKYKLTGGGAGHPHRVYLILFDNWNDKKNFLMSSAQADQNRQFIDSRCAGGSCWYTTSDNLEPAPDSNELFNRLDESENKLTKPKVGDYLISKGNLRRFTFGKEYRIDNIKFDSDNDEVLVVKNDNGNKSHFTIELLDGKNYLTWFDIVPYEIINFDFFGSLNESEKRYNKYKVGDKFYSTEDRYMNGNPRDRRFMKQGDIYEIIEVDPYYNWEEYGYRGNRYIIATDIPSKNGHGFSDVYIDKNLILIDDEKSLDIDYDSLYESEEDDLEWAREVVSQSPLIRPDGIWPHKGDRIRITSKDIGWLDEYHTCFNNPREIVVDVIDVSPRVLEVGTLCETDEFEIDFYVPFEIGTNSFSDMDRYGIKIYPVK